MSKTEIVAVATIVAMAYHTTTKAESRDMIKAFSVAMNDIKNQ